MKSKAPAIKPTFDIETSIPGVIAGIDEAGRGPWAGPVVAAAVVLDPETMPEGLHDSKKLSEKRRGELAASLWDVASIGVGVASVEEIDKINILQATLLAMSRAAANLPETPGRLHCRRDHQTETARARLYGGQRRRQILLNCSGVDHRQDNTRQNDARIGP